MPRKKQKKIGYEYSFDWTKKARDIVEALEMAHIKADRISVIESTGTKTRRTIARIHTLDKPVQLGMGEKPFYVIELLKERFDKQDKEEQVKTIIHELLHIPHNFGGGFRHHRDHVTNKIVEGHYRKLREACNKNNLTFT